MQDVLSKRVVQLEAKLQQQMLDKKDAAEESVCGHPLSCFDRLCPARGYSHRVL